MTKRTERRNGDIYYRCRLLNPKKLPCWSNRISVLGASTCTVIGVYGFKTVNSSYSSSLFSEIRISEWGLLLYEVSVLYFRSGKQTDTVVKSLIGFEIEKF